MSARTFLAALCIACTRLAAWSSVSADWAPMLPLVVNPMWGISTSPPAFATAAGHAETTRVVNDDQVDAAGLGALGADAGAGAAAYDRFAGRHLGTKTLQTLVAGEKAHGP